MVIRCIPAARKCFNPRFGGEAGRTEQCKVLLCSVVDVSIPDLVGRPVERFEDILLSKSLNFVSIPDLVGRPVEPFSEVIPECTNVAFQSPIWWGGR